MLIDQHQAALRRSMYATAAGLLMFSQSELQEAVEEPEEGNDRSVWERMVNGWNAFNSKLKAIFLGCMYLLVELLGSCKRKPLYLTRLVLHSILKISYF